LTDILSVEIVPLKTIRDTASSGLRPDRLIDTFALVNGIKLTMQNGETYCLGSQSPERLLEIIQWLMEHPMSLGESIET
jgi:hypothetical protein